MTSYRLLVAAMLLLPAVAFAYCPEPTEPFCIQWDGKKLAEDQRAFKWCRVEVETFVSELANWAKCKQTEAVEKGNAAVEKFNCYARGESLCM